MRSIDMVRGIMLLGMILAHGAVYEYARIFEVDFENPPLVIGIMGFFVLLGGSFIMMSGLVNTAAAVARIGEGQTSARAAGRNLAISGLVILVLNYLYVYFFGPATLDFDAKSLAMTMIPASIRAGALVVPSARLLLDGSSISIIAWDLLLMGGILTLLLRGGGTGGQASRSPGGPGGVAPATRTRAYVVLSVLAAAVFALGFFRYLLYPAAPRAIAKGQWVSAVFLNLLLEKPYPLVPYFSFGVVGMIMGLAATDPSPRRPLSVLLAVGILALVVGAGLYVIMPATIGQVTVGWFSRVVLELGLFMTVGSALLRFRETGSATRAEDRLPPPRRQRPQGFLGTIGRASLTIYFLQPPLSELLARAANLVVPGWSDSLGLTMAFAAANVIAWALVLLAWRAVSYRYSLDWVYARVLAALGRESLRDRIDGRD